MARKSVLLSLTILLGNAPIVLAIPVLQVYVEDAVYDSQSESWVLPQSEFPVKLWVIADSPVSDVKLSAVYDALTTPTIALTGSTTGNYGGFVDPSVAPDAQYIRTVTDGSSPTLGDGSDLPTHGVYGSGAAWQEFALGDFTLTDSPLADFYGSLPTPGNKWGQINVYNLAVSGASSVHIDVYDHVAAGSHVKYTFAPFSHDAAVPEPTSGLLAIVVASMLLLPRRRKAA